jgi:FkbM family methyltransferase
MDATSVATEVEPRPRQIEYLKHLLVGTPAEHVAAGVRRVKTKYLHIRVPELSDIWAEPARIDAAVRRIVRPGHNVLDIGAHLGSFTSLATRVSPTGQHIAIEALQYKAAWLRTKFPKVDVIEAAVSDAEGTVTFHHNVGRSGYSGIDAHTEEGDRIAKVTVRTARIDDLVPADRRVDFLKIDVEGGELRALAGATRVLDEYRPPVLFECTSTTTDAETRRGLYEFFTGRGYRVCKVGDWVQNGSSVGYDEFEATMEYPFRAFNFLALP